MTVTVNANNIVLSQDGTSPDTVIERANIASVRGVATISGTNTGSTNQSLPYNRQNRYTVEIQLNSNDRIRFDVQDVSNQPTWTANQAGLNNAVNALKS